ncbi:hypothetical protein HZB97_00855 [Candidatus Gottesmanbacteria bacterium]|nr:hypothetical protein [Candidatus Gottesmanbacteria bacterium]MBI5465378.1 hypothetical protein [Candidatus Gottesmanbacteria bacterium]
MERREATQLIGKISEDILASTTNIILYLFFLTSASFFKSPTSRGVYQTFAEADEIFAQINYQAFKRAFMALKKQRLLTVPKEGPLQVEITKRGRERLERILPHYEEKRPWDKKIYLVTYDIPIKRNKDRNLLRSYLRRLGCALLQESVWVTPYNPKKILAEFVRERGLSGVVLVSDLGLDGKIGDEDLKTFLGRIYKLGNLNYQYKEFLKEYLGKRKFSLLEVSFAFNKILKNDPQLPFELLAKDWQGKKAYDFFLRLTNNFKR